MKRLLLNPILLSLVLFLGLGAFETVRTRGWTGAAFWTGISVIFLAVAGTTSERKTV